MKGEILDCNIATEILSGFKKQDLIGNNFLKVSGIPDKYIPIVLDDYKIILKGENPARREIQLYTKEGNLFWVVYQASRIKLNEEDLILLIIQDIREQKKAELKLKESEGKFRELFNHMSSGVAVYEAINNGEDFIFKDFNLAGERIDNVKKEELIGKRVLEKFPGIKKFGLFDVFQRVWKTGVPEQHPISQYEDERINGWRENYVYKLPTGEIIAVFDDITERKQIEFELEKYRKHLEESVQDQKIKKEEVDKQLSKEIKEHEQTCSDLNQILNSSIPICVIDKNHEFLRINDTYANFFRISKENVIGKKCYELMHFDNCHTPRCTLKQILNGAILVESEKRMRFNDGNEIYYLVRATPYRDSNGNTIGIVETYTDITQRIRIEKAVIESEEKYRLITETAHDLIRVLNDKFEIEYINEAAHLKLLGYSKDELIKIMRRKIVHPDEVREGIKFYKKILKEGEAVREGRFRHKDGHWLWFEVKGKNFIDKDGNQKTLYISRDISERKKYEKMLKEFIITASHQLRTPVSALVQSLANLKKYNTQLDEDTKVKLIEVISRNVSRLSELVESLLNFSEIDDQTIFSPNVEKSLKKEKD